jgi:hypothetical protein
MNRVVPFLLRTSIIALALVILGWLLGVLFPGEEITGEATGFVGSLVLPFLSAFLLAAALAYPISRSRLSGKALFGVVFLAVFGLMTVLTLVEAAVFLNITPGELLIEIVKSTLTSAALSWLAVTLYPKLGDMVTAVEHGPNPPTTASWVRRWVGVSLIYLVLYITAGILILPLIRTWYEAQGTLEPNPALLFPLQIARGALFVAFVLPLLRSMSVTRRQASLAMAVMIPLVHGVAALIPPNPFMPDYVRHAHMIEIGWSNFVLGLLIGFLFWNPPLTTTEPAQSLEEAA